MFVPKRQTEELIMWKIVPTPLENQTSIFLDDFTPWPWSRCCPVVRAEVVAMFWRLRKLGVDLPAEPGVIVFDGGLA